MPSGCPLDLKAPQETHASLPRANLTNKDTAILQSRANAPSGAEQSKEEQSREKKNRKKEQRAHLRSKQQICVITIQRSSCDIPVSFFLAKRKRDAFPNRIKHCLKLRRSKFVLFRKHIPFSAKEMQPATFLSCFVHSFLRRKE